jgi:indolepyruvate ferredoxin oxidoreductase
VSAPARRKAYLSGVQALVRLPLMQQLRDEAAGLNTAGFVSGYRGSPLGGFDLELWKAKKHLAREVPARPQRRPRRDHGLGHAADQPVPGAKVDGVFGMWYGKGPGVDRCGDVFKHANAAGTSKHGGVLALAGDDHACRSSTLPHGSNTSSSRRDDAGAEPGRRAGHPRLMGLLGWAMSPLPGAGSASRPSPKRWSPRPRSTSIRSPRSTSSCPTDFPLPPGGLNIRWPDPPLDQEMRLHRYKRYAAQAFARANGIDQAW